MATTRSRSTGTAKRTPTRRRAPNRAASPSTTSSAAAKAISSNARVLTIVGVVAGAAAAGVALFLNRDRVRTAAASSSEKIKTAATTGSEKIKKVADDLSTIAHEKIDLARDNITKFRARRTPTATTATDTTEQPFAAAS
jgi:Mce-associated membrane protein